MLLNNFHDLVFIVVFLEKLLSVFRDTDGGNWKDLLQERKNFSSRDTIILTIVIKDL